jgi:hypothetical protein
MLLIGQRPKGFLAIIAILRNVVSLEINSKAIFNEVRVDMTVAPASTPGFRDTTYDDDICWI